MSNEATIRSLLGSIIYAANELQSGEHAPFPGSYADDAIRPLLREVDGLIHEALDVAEELAREGEGE